MIVPWIFVCDTKHWKCSKSTIKCTLGGFKSNKLTFSVCIGICSIRYTNSLRWFEPLSSSSVLLVFNNLYTWDTYKQNVNGLIQYHINCLETSRPWHRKSLSKCSSYESVQRPSFNISSADMCSLCNKINTIEHMIQCKINNQTPWSCGLLIALQTKM